MKYVLLVLVLVGLIVLLGSLIARRGSSGKTSSSGAPQQLPYGGQSGSQGYGQPTYGAQPGQAPHPQDQQVYGQHDYGQHSVGQQGYTQQAAAGQPQAGTPHGQPANSPTFDAAPAVSQLSPVPPMPPAPPAPAWSPPAPPPAPTAGPVPAPPVWDATGPDAPSSADIAAGRGFGDDVPESPAPSAPPVPSMPSSAYDTVHLDPADAEGESVASEHVDEWVGTPVVEPIVAAADYDPADAAESLDMTDQGAPVADLPEHTTAQAAGERALSSVVDDPADSASSEAVADSAADVASDRWVAEPVHLAELVIDEAVVEEPVMAPEAHVEAEVAAAPESHVEVVAEVPADAEAIVEPEAPEAPEAAVEPEAEEPTAPGRRISELSEVQDGGHGVGSAAPVWDGAQPLGHPIQAYRDTMSYRVPGAAGYDSAEPDVWFFDEWSAQRAGYHPSQG
ncbi:MAG: hypothetical protein KBB39_06505 [Phycicoccus sp.]|nr:hypothetical protein [Phycicoccus sp.]